MTGLWALGFSQWWFRRTCSLQFQSTRYQTESRTSS